MGQIFIRGVELPAKVKGVTVKDGDDFFIFINTLLTDSVQRKTIQHEIAHVKMEHFYDENPVIVDEMAVGT